MLQKHNKNLAKGQTEKEFLFEVNQNGKKD